MSITEIKAKILVNEMNSKTSTTAEERLNYAKQANYYRGLLDDYLVMERLRKGK